MDKTFAMISLGCAKNLVNSEQMLYLLDEAGFVLVPEPEGADSFPSKPAGKPTLSCKMLRQTGRGDSSCARWVVLMAGGGGGGGGGRRRGKPPGEVSWHRLVPRRLGVHVAGKQTQCE